MTTEISLAKTAATPGTESNTPSIQGMTINKDGFKDKTKELDKKSGSKRIEVENLAKELKKKLGTNWDKYQSTISLFLMGRLSRKELTSTLDEILLDSKMIRIHNQLLLANLANSLRDGPLNGISSNSGFGKFGSNKKKGKVKISNQYEKLKKDIMALPIKERRRIKSITRDSGKKTMANSALTFTRQALLPKIPYVSDKEKVVTGNTVEWTQDISHSLQALLSTETYSLPDIENLKVRMLGIAREHGLTGSLNKDAVEMLYTGLEFYLKNLLEASIDTVRYRKRKYTQNLFGTDIHDESNKKQKVTLTNEDLVDTMQLSPFYVEQNGPMYRLFGCQLHDDSYVPDKTSVDVLLKPRDEVFRDIEESKLKLKPDSSKTDGANKSQEASASSESASNADKNAQNRLPDGSSNSIQNGTQSTSNENNASGANSLLSTNIGTRDELKWLIHDLLSSH